MKLPNPYGCDVCKRKKEATNHWWIMWVGSVGHQEDNSYMPALVMSKWNDGLKDGEGHIHLCSRDCAVKAQDYWMSTGSLPVAGVFPPIASKALQNLCTESEARDLIEQSNEEVQIQRSID